MLDKLYVVLGELSGKDDDGGNRRASPGFYRKRHVSHAQLFARVI